MALQLILGISSEVGLVWEIKCKIGLFWEKARVGYYPTTAIFTTAPAQRKFAEVGSGSTAKKELSQLAKRRRHHRKKITRENDFDDDEQYRENPSSSSSSSSLSRRASLVERKLLLPDDVVCADSAAGDWEVTAQVTNIEYEEHKGRIAIGRLHAGVLRRGLDVQVCTTDETCRYVRVSELFVYEKFSRVAAQAVEAGDICVVCGIDDIQIGETIADKISEKPLPAIKVEEPTVKMAFSINTSPFVGRELISISSLWSGIDSLLFSMFALRENGETADTFIISGRGTLHITILIENMRREGYEFMVGPPKVINKRVDDKLLEPYEIATVEVPEQHMGPVVELLGKRSGQMFDMQGLGSEATTFLKYKIPTRGLLGLQNAILTASRGTTILNTIFGSYGPWAGDITTRDQGSLVNFLLQLNLIFQAFTGYDDESPGQCCHNHESGNLRN
ncbi:hypothetical protein TEA_012816 [Camellia sinensis var. sinensis]|uniref:Elongation factor EFG domain-containing protein n=1 Tax=Camellia sinensis var. sinensis TaxID=542762 RepID=A0A4S4D266_CAMSN|nr:hypothetical protein TEA_012816 [Camellia sinensis var. sinensis]